MAGPGDTDNGHAFLLKRIREGARQHSQPLPCHVMEGDPLQFLEPGLQTNEKHVDRNAGTVRIADFILRGDTLHFDERFQPVSFVIKPLGQLELAQPEVALGDITVVRLILPDAAQPCGAGLQRKPVGM